MLNQLERKYLNFDQSVIRSLNQPLSLLTISFRKLLIEHILEYGPVTKEILKDELRDVYQKWMLNQTDLERDWRLKYSICEGLRSEPDTFSELIARYKESTNPG